MTAWVALILLLGGIAIGATSIGGVVVVPALTALGGIAPERAVAAASFGFAFAGLAAFAARPRGRPGDADAAAAVETPDARATFGWAAVLGTAAGAASGAATLAWLPARAVALVVALLAIGSGLHVLLRPAHGHRQRALPRFGLPLLALVVGALSAWSGTGGPVVLLPLLALLGWPPLKAVEAAQRVQLPVAAAATTVNIAAGRLDWLLGAAVGVLVLAGWAAGRFVAGRLPMQRLRQAVAVALVATGVAYL
ncbi:MAG: TSUP family transporter [Rubrivivax sp.]|nr:TSUP family transporter [Rubrivivax sp.]